MEQKTILCRAFFIMQLSQIGNVGPHEIKAISGQPEGGFSNENEALHHLEDLILKSGYP